eukprot:c8087_g1_i1 orf=96-458(+)
MGQQGIKIPSNAFAFLLQQCINMKALTDGKQIHAHIIKGGLKGNVFLGNSLVIMYARCGSIRHARQVFDKMSMRNTVSWTAMISGYVQHGHCEEALKLFWQMEQEFVMPDNITFVSVLKA